MFGTRMIVAGLAVAGALSGAGLGAQGFDMRDCGLTQTTFVDTYTGDLFRPEAVGRIGFLLCDRATRIEPADDMTDPGDCMGPYSHLLLEGRLLHGGRAEGSSAATAMWSVMPSLPCCGWRVDLSENIHGWLYGGDGDALPLPEVDWIAASGMLTVGDLPDPVIKGGDSAIAAEAQLAPLICHALGG